MTPKGAPWQGGIVTVAKGHKDTGDMGILAQGDMGTKGQGDRSVSILLVMDLHKEV